MNEWVYILSPSFSGSTLLTFLLGTHPEIATIGELKATAMGNVDEYNCSCGARIRDCTFWRRVGEGVHGAGRAFNLADFGTTFRLEGRALVDRLLRAQVRGPLFEIARRVGLTLIPSATRNLNAILDQNRVLSEVIVHEQGGSVFLDGSKDPTRLLHLSRAGFAHIKVIYLLRDGRGSACSFMNHYRISMAEAANMWRKSQQSCERTLTHMPSGSWLRIRYETLCAEPEATLKQIFTFLALDAGEAIRDFRDREQHILGNAMRLSGSGEVRLNEKWRSELTKQDVSTFDRLAGKINRGLGYE